MEGSSGKGQVKVQMKYTYHEYVETKQTKEQDKTRRKHTFGMLLLQQNIIGTYGDTALERAVEKSTTVEFKPLMKSAYHR